MVLAALVAYAQSTVGSRVVQQLPIGESLLYLGQSVEIDWTLGVIRARGAGTATSGLTLAQARLRAIGAARADAQRLLATAIGDVRITSDTIVSDYVLASDTVRTQIDTVLRGIVYPEDGIVVEQLPDGSFVVHAVAEVPLYGTNSLGSAVYQGVRASFDSEGSQASYQEPTSNAPYTPPVMPQEPAPAPERPDTVVPSGAYTGLIIDASAFAVNPTMAPRVFSESGEVVYGVLSTTTEYANDVGVVGYYRSLGAALVDGRVGDNPLVVSAIDVVGKNIFREHPIISDGDAASVSLADEAVGFLEQARVAFIVQ